MPQPTIYTTIHKANIKFILCRIYVSEVGKIC